VPRTSTFKSGPVPVEDGGTFQLHRFTAPEEGIGLYSAGVSNLNGSVPVNLKIQLINQTTGGTLYSNSVDFEEGNPLNTFDVPGDNIEARISNQSGTVVDCYAFIDLGPGVFLSGTITVSGSLTAGVDVFAWNDTLGKFEGHTITDSDGTYSIPVGGGEILVGVDYYDGSTYYGDEKSIQT